MPTTKFTPADQSALAQSTDGVPSPDTDVALLSYPAGGAENIVVSVTATYDGDNDGGASTPDTQTEYSFDGVGWTIIYARSDAVYNESRTDTVNVGNGDLTTFRVRAYAATTPAGLSVPSATCTITAWHVTFDQPGMVVEA